MDFVNGTPFHTLIHRAALKDDIIAMSLMCRVTYDILEDGTTAISSNQDWELHSEIWESDYGPMDTDDVYNKGGVDIMVFGSVKAPRNKKITESTVIISLNNKELHKVKVFGNRTWTSFFGSMSISAPEPFSEMPLSLYNSFGGTAKWDGLEVPYPSNPYGKGYYHTKEEAVGNVLPNIEHYDDLITKWNSWQEPAGVSAMPIMPLKAKHNLILNEDNTKIEKLDIKFFNSAFPKMITNEIKVGDMLSISGVTGGDDFLLEIPNTDLEIEVKLGDKSTKRKMKIDQVGIVLDKNQFFMSYRFPFRYILKPMEKRETILNLNSN